MRQINRARPAGGFRTTHARPRDDRWQAGRTPVPRSRHRVSGSDVVPMVVRHRQHHLRIASGRAPGVRISATGAGADRD
ncbi:hypothetical protein chiPu_0029054, partial [Chiloscyllium punctatum]|nr:hypothetical protein [Chiloscyllium punctatum]